jgi:hypothetical protein
MESTDDLRRCGYEEHIDQSEASGQALFEIVSFTKSGGPLTKRISLADDGSLCSDGSACVMSVGSARRARFDTLSAFASHIDGMASNEAIALGALRRDLQDAVSVTTKAQLTKLNGSAAPSVVARSADHIGYEAGRTALALIDIDTKGMPPEIRKRIKDSGGFWCALVGALPALKQAGSVTRRSTSAGISRTDTAEQLSGSNGEHVYVLVRDGADVDRFLRTLHERCWLAGFGWMMVGAGGQLLERSMVDRMVGAPERLVFEGAPILQPPLLQDQASRRAIVRDGAELDTRAVCPSLGIIETEALKSLKARSAQTLAPECATARERYVAERSKQLAATAGIASSEARTIIERQCDGTLLPDVVLQWDDDEHVGCTVADVLANPARFVGATLADPLEGMDYGRSKAKIMRRADGTVWIHSFAHGRTTYELRYDVRAATTAVQAAPPGQAADVFIKVALAADLNADDSKRYGTRPPAAPGSGSGRSMRS